MKKYLTLISLILAITLLMIAGCSADAYSGNYKPATETERQEFSEKLVALSENDGKFNIKTVGELTDEISGSQSLEESSSIGGYVSATIKTNVTCIYDYSQTNLNKYYFNLKTKGGAGVGAELSGFLDNGCKSCSVEILSAEYSVELWYDETTKTAYISLYTKQSGNSTFGVDVEPLDESFKAYVENVELSDIEDTFFNEFVLLPKDFTDTIKNGSFLVSGNKLKEDLVSETDKTASRYLIIDSATAFKSKRESSETKEIADAKATKTHSEKTETLSATDKVTLPTQAEFTKKVEFDTVKETYLKLRDIEKLLSTI